MVRGYGPVIAALSEGLDIRLNTRLACELKNTDGGFLS